MVVSVRLISISLFAIMALSACGGGGGENTNSAPPRNLSNDASLSGLGVSDGVLVPVFVSGQTAYNVIVDPSVSTFSVTPTTSHPNATVTVNGNAVISGTASATVEITSGDNTVTVVVTAQDGTTTQTYSITVHKTSQDASLLGLVLSSGALDQVFQFTLRSYTAIVGYLQTAVRVTAATVDPNASLMINGMTVASGEESGVIALDEGLNIVTVTVTAEDGVTVENYTIELTRENANTFAQQAYVKASNTGVDDRFGSAVSLSGDTLATGAVCENSVATGVNGDQTDNSASCVGAVYVFNRDSSGTWFQQAYIKASNADAVDLFGSSVSVSGSTLAVGAHFEDGQGNNRSGAVYVFNRDAAGIWSQQAYLKASNAGADDYFGWSLSLFGDTLAVGAPREDSGSAGVNADQQDNSLGGAGAVYVFIRDGSGSWSQRAYVKPSNPVGGASFGHSVSVFDDTVAVGAPYEHGASAGINGDQSDQSAFYSGAVYVFIRNAAGTWGQQAYTKASNIDWNDWFGYSVSLSGDTLAVGAYQEDSSATGVHGDDTLNNSVDSGAVYVFIRDGSGTWFQQAYIKASNTGAADFFGTSVSLSDDTLAVGAHVESSAATGVNGDQADNSTSGAGAVYVFIRDGSGSWSQRAYVKASNAEGDDQFGFAVSIFGDVLAVGALYEDSAATGVNGDQTGNAFSGSGAVYVFR
jgi:hypothetical protein